MADTKPTRAPRRKTEPKAAERSPQKTAEAPKDGQPRLYPFGPGTTRTDY